MGPEVSQFEGSKAAADLTQPAQWLGEVRHDLEPYLNFILQNREQAIRGYQADLASCQNTLNYALRARPATPIPNVMPVLKGVRHPRPTSNHGRQSKAKQDSTQAERHNSTERSPVTR